MICLQGKVLPDDGVEELNKSLASLPDSAFFSDRINMRRGLIRTQPSSHRFENPLDSWFPVTFRSDGCVLEEKMSLPFSQVKNYKTIQKTVLVALEWMAKQLEWQGQTRQMGMSIMQHHALKKGEAAKEIPWHRDNSRHTLVILLDDEEKWEGGLFHFQVGEEKQQTFQPKKGYGVLFTNEGTKHCLDSFQALEEGINRTILTLHEKSSLTL